MTYFLCLVNNICLERRQGLFYFIICKQKGQKVARDFGRITKLFKRAGSSSKVLNEVKLDSRLSQPIMPQYSLWITYWLYYRLYSPTLLKIYQKKSKKKVKKKSQKIKWWVACQKMSCQWSIDNHWANSNPNDR